jgi:fructose-bisphosphate aldolase class II
VTLVPTGELVEAAAEHGRAVGAFNVITLEHAEAILTGAEACGLPVIFQVSQNAVSFHGGRLAAVSAAARELAVQGAVPVALHLDHVEQADLVRQAAEHGYSSVMVDASRLPYAENVALTAELTETLHQQGLWVEAELGEVGGKDGAHAPGTRTDPDEAAAFVEATGVDALAVAVGSSHAMLERRAELDIELVGRLAAAVPVPLVLHGSSGVSELSLVAAVEAGIRKVNIGTALNIAFTAAVRDRLAIDESVDPRTYLAPARTAMSAAVEAALRTLAGA